MKKKYCYFVSYNADDAFGNCELLSSKKIKKFEDLNDTAGKLEEILNKEKVIILNYIRLKKKSTKIIADVSNSKK